ncbi:MAG TPA: 30S ribosomal protein S12 methylthiotransferase RimO [Deinococcales bacterium]|nr:30S ribosomal protein S12 methylthiotransferase RimO [Deinococcales bacterium]
MPARPRPRPTIHVSSHARPRKVGFVSLGCAKNLVDSERILTQLRSEGYTLADGYEDAGLVIVNTCGFITPAVEESLGAIGEALEGTGKVVVTGCLGERPEAIRQRHPQVLDVTGPGDVSGVMKAVHAVLPPDEHPFTRLTPLPPSGIKLTPRHYSYLKIAEGCNHACGFCIIPQLRGTQVSRDAADLMVEATRLVATGTRELLVIAQDSSAYGVDIRHRASAWQERDLPATLPALAEALAGLGVWVRLHYVYPYPSVDRLVELMAAGKLVKYLDVPLQHASERVLRSMRRPGAARALEAIERWRRVCPDLTLRSTFIVGYPGETEAEFEELLAFLRVARLDRVGAFPYSAIEGAPANGLPDHVPEEVKQERLERFMAVQQEISAAKNLAKVGRTLPVIVDELNDDPGDPPGTKLIGRTEGDAPGVDGLVYLASDGKARPGDLVLARIEDADEYDLFGEVIERREWPLTVPQWR